MQDVSSPSIPTMSLPLVTLPHIATSSLALSIMGDLMPRLSHSSPSIRKKTIVTLYRLALAYPEVLRPAWPKIKDMLMNADEDRSVTAAVVNVVCELGWRRPRDFLPLAPRLFDLLVDGGNNWMAIKIIKLVRSVCQSCGPSDNSSVCYSDAPGTSSSEEAATSVDKFDQEDPGHVALV